MSDSTDDVDWYDRDDEINELKVAIEALKEIAAGYHCNIQECMNIAKYALKQIEE